MNRNFIILSSALLLGGAGWLVWQDPQNPSETHHKPRISKSPLSSHFKDKIAQSAQEQALAKRNALLRTILNSKLSWQKRVPAAESLSKYEIDDQVLSQLYAFLRTPAPQREEDFFVVGNEIMAVLRELNIDQKVYTAELLRLIEDPEAQTVMRDYAVQHLVQGGPTQPYPASSHQAPKTAAFSLKHDTFQRILNVISDPQNAQQNFIGTALTSLHVGLSSGQFAFDPEIEKESRTSLGQLALEMAKGSHPTTSVNRLTALQVAAEMKLPETAGISRNILKSSQNHLSSRRVGENSPHSPTSPKLTTSSISTDIQLSAIAALGRVGDFSDIALLEQQSQDVLVYAAEAATKLIRSRH